MIIRSEQRDALTEAATITFANRLVAHIRAVLPDARVILPGLNSTVAEINDNDLKILVRRGITIAKQFGLNWESTIAKFVSLMVEVAPNFCLHPGIYPLLANPNIHQQLKIDDLFTLTDDSVWEEVAATYDSRAWTSEEIAVEGTKS